MPRGVYVRRPRTVNPMPPADAEQVEAESTEQVEQLAAPEAAFLVPEPVFIETAAPVSTHESCAMVERKWRGYPVWQCRKCRVDTLDPGLASAARRACRK